MRRNNRRTFIKESTIIGAVALAGCLGGADDTGDDNGTDEVGFSVGSASEGSVAYQMSQSIQRVVDDNSDRISFNTTATGGDPASIRLYEQGDIEGYAATNYIVRKVLNNEDPFEGEENEVPYQGFTHQVRDDWFMAVDGSGIETTDDIPGSNFQIYSPGWGTRELVEEIFQTEDPELYDEIMENVVDIEVEDTAGAIEEGTIDAFIGYGSNRLELPAWLAEVDARADIHHVELSDRWRDILESSSLAPTFEHEPFGFEQNVGDQLEGIQIQFQYLFGPDVPNDAMYEVLEIMYENSDSLREGYSSFYDYGENPENFVHSMEPDLGPVHPGAAEFYQDQDVWDDELEVGD